MSRSLRRGSIAAVAAIAIASLSSCAAGNAPDTLQIKPDNAAATIGTNLRLNNIVVVTPGKATGDYTGPASVIVNIANTGTGAAELKTVVLGGGNATFTDASGASVPSIVIPAGGSVAIGGKGNPSATVSSANVKVGGFAKTAFGIQEGKDGQIQTVTAEAGVTPDSDLRNKDIYSGYGPSPSASPAAVPTKAASPAAGATTGTPTAGATTGTQTAGATSGAATPAAGTTPTAH
ncbi:hypothetical protein [Streptomyces sp. NRRL WC-3742]|uniref:hypothetical protein n=1 Tax=Streptomyces sp. NRRL WC-3742 TaxID=1463934 RepID=UPI0004CAA3FB|nr:hypothetical protein [Streptomyces sp. NRRL WC-3742]